MTSSSSLKVTREFLLFLLDRWISRLPSSMVSSEMRLLWAVLNSVRFCRGPDKHTHTHTHELVPSSADSLFPSDQQWILEECRYCNIKTFCGSCSERLLSEWAIGPFNNWSLKTGLIERKVLASANFLTIYYPYTAKLSSSIWLDTLP